MDDGTRERRHERFALAFACVAFFAALALVATDYSSDTPFNGSSIDPDDAMAIESDAHDTATDSLAPPNRIVAKEFRDLDQESGEKISDGEHFTSSLVGEEVGAGNRKKRRRDKWKSAVLEVVTNFDRADVTVNGLPYPEYQTPDAPAGMILPAGGPYEVEVKYGGKTKLYHIHLRANETRLLIVELSGYKGTVASPRKTAAKPAPTPPPKPKPAKESSDSEEPGKVTVYSKPAGKVIVDGNATGEATPGTVEIENGRHEVQVEYENGEVSEKKIVRVRDGSRIKLFFRQRKKK